MAQAFHKFSIGSFVRFSPGAYEAASMVGTYTVVRQLPPEPGDCQYRVKSILDGHERVVRESQLTPGPEDGCLAEGRLCGHAAELTASGGSCRAGRRGHRGGAQHRAQHRAGSGAGRRPGGRHARSSVAAAEDTAQAIRDAGGEALVHIADVTDEAATLGLMAAAAEAFGGLDILVNNAAIRRETAFAELTPAHWREVLGVILDGAYLCTRAALPYLQRSSMASIVNIGGMSAHTGSPRRAHVVAAKAGLAGLTRALAHDFGPDGITVNCVVPGLIDTVRGASATGTPAMHSLHAPLVGRRGRPERSPPWCASSAGRMRATSPGRRCTRMAGPTCPDAGEPPRSTQFRRAGGSDIAARCLH
ncbi:MAG: SDR family oxidoreductase [Acetobacteraceae bacterium]